MARDRANVRIEIWTDDDWRALSMRAQWLYLLLLTHGSLTYAGVADWREGRLAALAVGVTRADVEAAGAELEERHFIVTDAETEEVLIRSFLRHDGVMVRPNVAVAMAKSFAAVGSDRLRAVIVHELKRLRDEHPEWPAWEKPTVMQLLSRRSLDVRAEGSGNGSSNPSDNRFAEGSGNLPVDLPPTTATATSTATATPPNGGGPRLFDAEQQMDEPKKREVRLPRSWAPTANHVRIARERGVDLGEQVERFREHAETHDRHAANWNSAFTTWLKKSRPSSARVSHAMAAAQLAAQLEAQEQGRRALSA